MLSVSHMQAQCRILVAIASAVGAHIFEHVFAVLVKDHHGEILIAFHELVGVAGGRHIDGDGADVVLPDVAQRAPSDGHRVVATHIAGGQQQSAALEPGERIGVEFFSGVEEDEIRLGNLLLFLLPLLDGELIAINVVGDIFGFPFVFGLVVFVGVADHDDVERDEVFGQFQHLRNGFAALLVGVSARPHRAQTHRMGGQEDVFGGGGAVLHPKLARFTTQGLLHVATHHNGQRRTGEHVGIGVGFGERLQLRFVVHHHEVPRLTVHCGGCRHSRTQQLLNGCHIYGFVGVAAHRSPRGDVFQHRVPRHARFLGVCFYSGIQYSRENQNCHNMFFHLFEYF